MYHYAPSQRMQVEAKGFHMVAFQQSFMTVYISASE